MHSFNQVYPSSREHYVCSQVGYTHVQVIALPKEKIKLICKIIYGTTVSQFLAMHSAEAAAATVSGL